MRTPLEIAVSALEQIVDTEKSASVGWNAAQNMVSIARRALQDIERHDALALDRSVDADAFPNK